MEVVLEIR